MDEMGKAISEMIENINIKKEDIIRDRLKQHKIIIDWELEKQLRFKSLAYEQSHDSETWYYDNGSVRGLRIVTFETKQKDLLDCENKFSIEYNYY